MRWKRETAAGDVILGKGGHFACDEFFCRRLAVGDESFGHQEYVDRDAQTCVVEESPPSAALAVSESEVLLLVLIVALGTR
jgi:hypothetical protein